MHYNSVKFKNDDVLFQLVIVPRRIKFDWESDHFLFGFFPSMVGGAAPADCEPKLHINEFLTDFRRFLKITSDK